MSIAIQTETLDLETRKRINRELPIKLENNKYNINAPPEYVVPYENDGETTVLPFSYATRILKLPRPVRSDFTEVRLAFEGSLRKEQLEVRNEAADIISKKGSVIVSAFCGFGKCMGFNTPVMMSDGSVKPVQNVQAGEQLMGDDSTPRNVLSIARGEEQMYRVNPRKGDSFTANESHILSLKIMSNRTVVKDVNRGYITRCFNHTTRRFEHKEFKRNKQGATAYVASYHSPDVLDIEIRDYLALPKSLQNMLLLYRVPVDFPATEVLIDPYLLGIWLGDGTSSQPEITSADHEVVTFLDEYCAAYGFRLHKKRDGKRKEITYRINDDTFGGNRLTNDLRDLDLLGNKHVPSSYLHNDRETRLQILAGLLDSDGYYTKGCYEIIQKREDLADDIVYLARSLGFAAYAKDVEKSCMYLGEKRTGTSKTCCVQTLRWSPSKRETTMDSRSMGTGDSSWGISRSRTTRPLQST
jgi:hypothetical protein